MLVKELKEFLGKLGLDANGTKPVLVARLEEAMAAGEEAEPDAEAAPAETTVPAAETTPAPAAFDLEKTKKRAERFGVPLVNEDDVKKKQRAERFGIPLPGQLTAEQQADLVKKQARAQRFGIPLALSEDEANKKRAERFGIPLVTKLEGKDGKQKQFRKFKKWGVGKPVGKKFRRNGGRQGDGLKSGNGGTQKNRTNKFKEGYLVAAIASSQSPDLSTPAMHSYSFD